GELATSASRSPTLFGYHAALAVLNAPVLFSKMKCSELMDPTVGGSVKLHRHHLFPKAFLSAQGIDDTRDTNQSATYALVEWHDTLAISSSDPAVYWPAYLEAMRNPKTGFPKFSEHEIARMEEDHALPSGWPGLAYATFLEQRRKLIAGVIRRAYEK